MRSSICAVRARACSGAMNAGGPDRDARGIERVHRGVALDGHRLAVGGRGAGEQEATAPVHQVDLAVAADHDVVGLDVAVDHAAAVREATASHTLRKSSQQLLEVAIRALLGRVRAQNLGQGAPAHELHGEAELARLVRPQIVDRRDVGVIELGRDLRLLAEAQPVGVRRRGEGEDLHGRQATQVPVVHAVDATHAALRELPAVLEPGAVVDRLCCTHGASGRSIRSGPWTSPALCAARRASRVPGRVRGRWCRRPS